MEIFNTFWFVIAFWVCLYLWLQHHKKKLKKGHMSAETPRDVDSVIVVVAVDHNHPQPRQWPWSKKDHEPVYTSPQILLDETEHSRVKVLHVELVRFADEFGRRVDVGETTYYLRYGYNCLQMKPGYYAMSTIKKIGLFGWYSRPKKLKYGRKSGEFQMPRGGIMVARKPAVCLGTLCVRFMGYEFRTGSHSDISPKFFDVTRHFEIKSMLLQAFQQKNRQFVTFSEGEFFPAGSTYQTK